MKIVKMSSEITMITAGGGQALLKHLENCGRVCYQSSHKVTDISAPGFVRALIKSGHESVIEHSSMSVRFIVSRRTSHALVRHRLCSFSQESSQYTNYDQDRFGNQITVIEPFNIKPGAPAYRTWESAI